MSGTRLGELRVTVPASTAECAYLAGIIDGEGSLIRREGADRRHPNWWLYVTNTDLPLLEWLQRMGGVVRPHGSGGFERRLPCFRWILYGQRDVRAVLEVVEPYLIVKRERAQQALAEFGEWFDA